MATFESDVRLLALLLLHLSGDTDAVGNAARRVLNELEIVSEGQPDPDDLEGEMTAWMGGE